ncbi:MAG: hypothetical protein HC872_08545 [Gammaproteobacteria bacterium]|nr:hypothetical protein [Gammaproteobacteria bacterium]
MTKTTATRWVRVILAMLFAANPAAAEIVSAAATGFNLRHVVEMPNAPPPTVWAALSDVAKWWDPEHTYSGLARNLSLDPVVSGCLCEKLSLYAAIEHARVIYALPTKTLRLSGALGPLQEFGVTGSLTWQIDVSGTGSRLTMTYSVGGYADRPLAEWARSVDEVLVSQAQRLGRFVNAGSPEPAKANPK